MSAALPCATVVWICHACAPSAAMIGSSVSSSRMLNALICVLTATCAPAARTRRIAANARVQLSLRWRSSSCVACRPSIENDTLMTPASTIASARSCVRW